MRTRSRINLCFHGIGVPGRDLDPGEDEYWISVDLYEQVLDAVAGREDVTLSFDDGNASDVEMGLEALLRRGLEATFFVLAGRIGSPGSLDVEGVRLLTTSGMTVGTHGMDHRSWRGMSPMSEERELVEARRIIEDACGARVWDAALPMGQYDRRVLARLRHHGYRSVHTSDRRRATADSWMQPRYSIRRSDNIDTVRSEVLAQPSTIQRLRRHTVGVLKRLR